MVPGVRIIGGAAIRSFRVGDGWLQVPCCLSLANEQLFDEVTPKVSGDGHVDLRSLRNLPPGTKVPIEEEDRLALLLGGRFVSPNSLCEAVGFFNLLRHVGPQLGAYTISHLM